MRTLKYILSILILSIVSCSDEPKATDDLPVRLLMQEVCEYDSDEFTSPENPPEYLIINSARDMAELPDGTLANVRSFQMLYTLKSVRSNSASLLTRYLRTRS